MLCGLQLIVLLNMIEADVLMPYLLDAQAQLVASAGDILWLFRSEKDIGSDFF